MQRTQAGAVSNYLPGFLQAFPNWQSIASADQDALGAALRPLGLWRRRAVALASLAAEIVRREGAWPMTREELESIPAVGQYVASAVLLFEHDERAPLLDAGMARVLRRYFAIVPEKADIRFDKQLQAVAHEVLGEGNPIELNWAILDFASLQCRKAASACVSCALNNGCKRYEVEKNPDC